MGEWNAMGYVKTNGARRHKMRCDGHWDPIDRPNILPNPTYI